MVKMFYSYNDRNVYMLHEHCPLELLMEEHTGGDGLLILASKKALEIVEYIDGVESGFATRVMPKVKEPVNELMRDMDKRINELFDCIAINAGEKC